MTEVMDGKVDVVLRFALATLFMRQGRPLAGLGGVSEGSIDVEGAGLAPVADNKSDLGFEPGQGDVGVDIDTDLDVDPCDGKLAKDGGETVLDVVIECMGRLRGVCEDSSRDEDRGERVEEGFRDAARALRRHSTRHDSFSELLHLLVDLLRAADAEGETMDAASISHGADRHIGGQNVLLMRVPS
jgi:hypothetical protein